LANQTWLFCIPYNQKRHHDPIHLNPAYYRPGITPVAIPGCRRPVVGSIGGAGEQVARFSALVLLCLMSPAGQPPGF
jgi:hypothetical protein